MLRLFCNVDEEKKLKVSNKCSQRANDVIKRDKISTETPKHTITGKSGAATKSKASNRRSQSSMYDTNNYNVGRLQKYPSISNFMITSINLLMYRLAADFFF